MRRPATGAAWRKNARRLLAVNPLIPAPHRQLARAAEQLGERDEAVAAYRALALLDDTDPAEVHYHLAKLLRQAGKPRRGPPRGPQVAGGSAALPATRTGSCSNWSSTDSAATGTPRRPTPLPEGPKP